MIPFKNRFHGHNSLRYVYKNGQAFRCRLLTIKIIKNPYRSESRMAVVISKKILKSAVGRNRIRRRVYEYARQKLNRLDQPFDIVFIISSSELLKMPYDDIVKQIDQLFDQAGV